MNKNIVLETERLVIKILKTKDINEKYIQGLNDPEVNKYLVSVRLKKQTYESVEAFVLSNLDSHNDFLFGVFLSDGGDLIGTIRMHDISYFHYMCNVGICFFYKKYWGKGYAIEALNKIVEFGFNSLGLHCIEAGVYSENISSMKLFKKAGFSMQAVYRDKYRYIDSFKEVSVFNKINEKFDFECLKS